MLRFNLVPTLFARGILRQSLYLTKTLGINPNTASNIKLGRANAINLKHLETLCVNLNCTPNDLLEWTPSQEVAADHSLNLLKKKEQRQQLSQKIQNMPLEKMEKLAKMIDSI